MAIPETRTGKLARPRFTVTAKILLMLGSSILLSVLAVGSLYIALRRVEAALAQVTQVAEPITAAAYEMEINILGAALGLMQYLGTGLPQHRQRVEKDTADFLRFKAQYDRLATTPPARHMGARIATLHAAFTALGGGADTDQRSAGGPAAHAAGPRDGYGHGGRCLPVSGPRA